MKNTVQLKIMLLSLFLSFNSCLTKHEDLGYTDPLFFQPSDQAYAIIFGCIEAGETVILEKSEDIEFYLLKGYMRIKRGGTLIIRPGVEIRGDTELFEGKPATLIVEQGGTILADGRPDESLPPNPIVFTSNKPIGERAPGDWGGIVIIGEAPVSYTGVSSGPPEDDPDLTNGGAFGGTEETSSGTLRYVMVQFAGYEIDQTKKELNGFSFYGVSRNTTVEFIQAHKCADDGIEMFGGTVDIRYAISTSNADECFDWVLGWQGRGQYWICKHCDEIGKSGIEVEQSDNPPPSGDQVIYPIIYNATLIGDRGEFATSDVGILFLQGNPQGAIYNSLIMDFKDGLVGIRDTTDLADRIIVSNSVFYRTDGGNIADDANEFDERPWLETQDNLILGSSASLIAEPADCSNLDFNPTTTLSNLVLNLRAPDQELQLSDQNFFMEYAEGAAFIGAISSAATNWTDEWASYPKE